MTSTLRILAAAGLALALPSLPAFAFSTGPLTAASAAAPAGVQLTASKYECFTDDGYGRRFPCSARYKRENPSWRSSGQCFTDEGYGRYRPCDSFYKGRQSKN